MKMDLIEVFFQNLSLFMTFLEIVWDSNHVLYFVMRVIKPLSFLMMHD